MFRFRAWVEHPRGRFAHIAFLEVEVTPAEESVVEVADSAFDWLYEAYGPDASTDGPADRAEAAEAVAGAWYALLRLLPDRYRVLLTRIQRTPVDTFPGDIQVAAALAVCDALGVHLDPPPRAGPDGPVLPA